MTPRRYSISFAPFPPVAKSSMVLRRSPAALASKMAVAAAFAAITTVPPRTAPAAARIDPKVAANPSCSWAMRLTPALPWSVDWPILPRAAAAAKLVSVSLLDCSVAMRIAWAKSCAFLAAAAWAALTAAIDPEMPPRAAASFLRAPATNVTESENERTPRFAVADAPPSAFTPVEALSTALAKELTPVDPPCPTAFIDLSAEPADLLTLSRPSDTGASFFPT